MLLQLNLQFLPVLCCSIFAGAALYINLVEHPARMSCGVAAALAQWAPSYRRATWLQAPLAAVGTTSAVLAWLNGFGSEWLIGGLLLGAVIPFTLVVIAPTNRKLLSLSPDSRMEETRQLLEKWNRLHAVRSCLAIAALVVFLLSAGR
ncbi:MAG: DUF1772 domain-containing protein [Terriglobia bacterium]